MTATRQVESLPAWKVIFKIVRYRLRLWLINLAAMLVLIFFWQFPAVVLREFFDLLTGEAQLGLNVWSVAVLLFACELGRVLGIYGLVNTNVPFFQNTMTLLRKNLLTHILKRPGASALPDSPGEAISRFRGDVFEIALFALWLNDIQGMIAFGVVALIMMVSINPSIALLAVLPFIVVGVIALPLLNVTLPAIIKWLILIVSAYVICNLIVGLYRRALAYITKRA